MSLSLLYLPLMRHAFEQRSTALLVACDLATATLNLFLVIRFGATPGKFVVLTNRRRRAIHDFIAGTYVVTLESWTRHHADSTDRALASVR